LQEPATALETRSAATADEKPFILTDDEVTKELWVNLRTIPSDILILRVSPPTSQVPEYAALGDSVSHVSDVFPKAVKTQQATLVAATSKASCAQ
jgi:hypothetical protein